MTPNTGTMPTGAFIVASTAGVTDATGATTARNATDVAGTSNPDIDATCTYAASTLAQRAALRRFVSPPLAAHTFSSTDPGQWTFSAAGGQSNTNHNQVLICRIYLWRPGTGLRVGTDQININTTPPNASTTAETAVSAQNTTSWLGTTTTLDGDLLVFEISDESTQTMSTAYTGFFSYDGTTEASATSCASFVTPPAALTLFTPTSVMKPEIFSAIPFVSTGGGPTMHR